ncbi:MAG TPA: hypothetical protein VGX24_03735 [Pyrinomonadaceae bacterium]|jgi:hypothetical protein|nr:hypothetical protein [Pyrinomonadaceae bacterium]
MTSEESEREARTGSTTTAAVPDATAGGAAEATAEVTAEATTTGSGETVAGAATPETFAGAVTLETSAEAATPTAIPPTGDPAATVEARDATLPPSSPPPEEGTRIGNSLEAIKTAVVWLVVIQILTILSPLLRVSLKWSLVVGLILTLSSFAVGVVAYLKAQRAQRNLPE